MHKMIQRDWFQNQLEKALCEVKNKWLALWFQQVLVVLDFDLQEKQTGFFKKEYGASF